MSGATLPPIKFQKNKIIKKTPKPKEKIKLELLFLQFFLTPKKFAGFWVGFGVFGFGFLFVLRPLLSFPIFFPTCFLFVPVYGQMLKEYHSEAQSVLTDQSIYTHTV